MIFSIRGMLNGVQNAFAYLHYGLDWSLYNGRLLPYIKNVVEKDDDPDKHLSDIHEMMEV